MTEVIRVPDLGGVDSVEIIELPVKAGDRVQAEDTLVVLESDKASMDLPASKTGLIIKFLVNVGDAVAEGDAIAEFKPEEATASQAEDTTDQAEPTHARPEPETLEAPQSAVESQTVDLPRPDENVRDRAAESAQLAEAEAPPREVYASPTVRLLARELGVDLRNVKGSGTKGRVQKRDVLAYLEKALTLMESGPQAADSASAAIPPVPDVDFAQFGPVTELELSKIGRLTAANMSRNWLNAPMVTQFDDADITDLEDFRRSLKSEAEKRGTRLTLLPILLAACAAALRNNPVINRSWHSSGSKAIQKHFCHIGIAVDTPRGLVVPVIRNVDHKGIWELAEEVTEIAGKAREGGLSAAQMQGGCFTISSLGAIGGRGFTPIVNSPESAILGVSRASVQPVWKGGEFVPRQLLPLCFTYDHRLVNGADAGRFMTDLVTLLSDLRRLLL